MWRAVDLVARVDLDAEAGSLRAKHAIRQRLHVARSGAFAAVVNDYGRLGLVVTCATGAVSMSVDGGEYNANQVPFSCCFSTVGGADVYMAKVTWGQLGVFDPSTGKAIAAEDEGDICHGRLHVSPDGTHILDDGWHWSPVGCAQLTDLVRWIGSGRPSWREVCGVDFFWWDYEMCWLDDRRVALLGIGRDHDHGARIFDVNDPRLIAPPDPQTTETAVLLPGPEGAFFGAGRRLFTSANGSVKSWDVTSGAQLVTIGDFAPQYQGRSAGELVELRGDHLRTWRYAPSE